MATSEIETQAVLASGGLHLFLSFLFSQVGMGGEERDVRREGDFSNLSLEDLHSVVCSCVCSHYHLHFYIYLLYN